MRTLADHPLTIMGHDYQPVIIGGMGVDISSTQLACSAAEMGAIGHISDAMSPFVSDKNFGTNFTKRKSDRLRVYADSKDKKDVQFDLADLRSGQMKHVENAMNQKRGEGAIWINIMEKLTMNNPQGTLEVRLNAALDAGIDGITLSAGLHTSSLRLMANNPRFRDAQIGIIVSSDRALKLFLRSGSRVERLPDYIIVEGPLAGGHLGFGEDWPAHSLDTIVADVARLLKAENLSIPIIAAGGIFTGSDALRAVDHGASAIQVATRFTITEECGLPSNVKQEYLRSEEKDVVVNCVSPTGYLMRMLSYSPCLTSNMRPSCEAFGYMLGREGKCQYLDAYDATPLDEKGKKLLVKEKICLCYHFSKFNCYTCGHNVFRLKDTTTKNPDGSYKLLKAQDVIKDYLHNE